MKDDNKISFADISGKPEIMPEKTYPIEQQTVDPVDDKASGYVLYI